MLGFSDVCYQQEIYAGIMMWWNGLLQQRSSRTTPPPTTTSFQSWWLQYWLEEGYLVAYLSEENKESHDLIEQGKSPVERKSWLGAYLRLKRIFLLEDIGGKLEMIDTVNCSIYTLVKYMWKPSIQYNYETCIKVYNLHWLSV